MKGLVKYQANGKSPAGGWTGRSGGKGSTRDSNQRKKPSSKRKLHVPEYRLANRHFKDPAAGLS
jgi:hypothetical protein